MMPRGPLTAYFFGFFRRQRIIVRREAPHGPIEPNLA
jgi:hypothetical protein